jgi:acetyl-CoA carboxylase carboxyltransferase component
VLTLHERHFVTMADGTYFELSNELWHLIKDITNIEGLGWQLRGNILGLNFELYDENGEVKNTYETVLTASGCYKAADFVRFCDAFEIPVITLTNVTGFAATESEEKKVADAAGKLTAAFAGANVPKVNVIVKKAVGSAYAVMNSKACGADFTIAFPDAVIGIMDAKLAAHVLCSGTAEEVAQTAAKYDALQNSIDSAAARGYVDQIIEPEDLRKYLIGAMEVLYTKREEFPAKKHSAK